MKYLDKDGLTYLWGKIKAKIPTKTSDLTNDSGFSTFSGSYNDLTNKPTIPAQLSAGSHIDITNNTIKNTGVWSVTESASSAANGTIQVVTGTSGGDSTVNVGVKGLSNAAYKNVDTSIASSPGTNLPTSTAVKNFVEGKGYITSYTETDPVFTASAAYGISSSDITNWNNKSNFSGSYNDLTNKPTIPTVGNAKNYYGTSTTAATTQAKTVTCSGFTLETGATIFVKFTNANTYNGTATLNVNSTGAKDIARVGTTKTTRYYWSAGEVVGFVYDGTNYVMIERGTASTTYYGVTKLNSSTSSTSTSEAATPSAVKAAYDIADSAASVASTASSASASALEIAQSKVGAWNYIDYISPGVTTSVSLPSGFKEALCVITVDGNNTVQLSIVIPNDRLSSTAVGFRAGYYRSANVNAYARVDVTSTAVTLNEVYLNGQAKTTSSTVYVYYR